MKFIIFAVVCVFMSSNIFANDLLNAANSECRSNKALIHQGFKIGTNNFIKTSLEVLSLINDNTNKTIIAFKGGTVHSSVTNRMITVSPYDDLNTPENEMSGDYVLITDFITGKVIEVRWYKNKTKSIQYSIESTHCVSNIIPFADNALY